MKKIAIQDANILIDLVTTGLFDHCLALAYQFATTNIILAELYEEQIAIIQPHISSGKFEIIAITDEELFEIQIMSAEDTRLSEQDWSAIFYAQKIEAFLLSGDKRLRTLAVSKQISVCGIFWLLDEMIKNDIIAETEACSFLKKLLSLNKRLPAEECSKRIKLWCSE